MKKSINEKYAQTYDLRNDIYRKFEKQFRYCFDNPVNLSEELYINHGMEKCEEALNLFAQGPGSDIRFLIGFTGVGKTTVLKHCFRYSTFGIKIHDTSIVIPNSFDGIRIPDEGYIREIDEQIRNTICILIEKVYRSYEEMLQDESDEIIEFISSNRTNIIPVLSLDEINSEGGTISQKKVQKCMDKWPVEFASSLLKYVIERKQKCKRIIFIVDDLETLSQQKLCYLIESYLKIYDCMHNMENSPAVKLIISLRPHSFRFLKKAMKYRNISAYGNYLQSQAYRLIKDEIPDIKEIFKARFEWAEKHTVKPGNPVSWNVAKEAFYRIINAFDSDLIQMIVDLCHMNIRSITDCFQMILSNRVWCQEYDEYTEYPSVSESDYRFDIVNVIRTIACGESSVYLGQKEASMEVKWIQDLQTRPALDGSTVFIPNILIDIQTRECDILPAIIIHYLDGYFELAGPGRSGLQSEFLTKGKLVKDLSRCFGTDVGEEKIKGVVSYLFENRIIRKSIINSDDDSSFYRLDDDDYLYLTRKGERLLEMFRNDSVLLEIYREDIVREYKDRMYKTSAELVRENDRKTLFEDILRLIEEIYDNEDQYQRYVLSTGNRAAFYKLTFPITSMLMEGTSRSLLRSQNLEYNDKNKFQDQLLRMKGMVQERICEQDNRI